MLRAIPGTMRTSGLRRILLSGALVAGVLGFSQMTSGASGVASPTLTVLAGAVASPASSTPQPALSTQFGRIDSIAVDRFGDTFVAAGDSTIVEVRPNGTTRLIAGTPSEFGTPTPGPATSSLLNTPFSLGVDGSGNLYVADIDANEVLKITPQGTLSVIAGTGTQGLPTPGPASASLLGRPQGIAIDGQGNIYVADTSNHVIEKVTPSGILSVFAGSGSSGAPVPGAALASPFSALGSLAVSGGSLYFVDHGTRQVGKISLTTRTLSLVAGSGANSYPSPGPALNTGFHDLRGLAVDRGGNVFFADSDNSIVARVTSGGTLSIVAGNGDYGPPTPGPATSTSMENPVGVAVDPRGNLVIGDANSGNGLVYQVMSGTGNLSVVAGNYPLSLPGPALSVTLNNLRGIAADAQGNTFGALPGESIIFKVTASGSVSVVAGNGSSGSPTPGLATASRLSGPGAVDIDKDGNLYIADTGNHLIEKVSPAGNLSVIAGNGTLGVPTPGPATASPMGYPRDITLDASGNLYISDAGKNMVEKVSPAGTLSIVAGNGDFGAPTPGLATASKVQPSEIAVDGSGNLFIADPSNSVVEEVSVSGDLSIVAGNGSYGSATPGPATSSPLSAPSGVAVDAVGNLYIAEIYGGGGCGSIEQVTPDGMLSTLSGTAACSAAVAGPAASSPVFFPSSLAINRFGNLEVSTYQQIVTIDLASAPHGPRIQTLHLTPRGLQVHWGAPTSLVGKVTSFVATATNAGGDVLGSCTTRGGDRICYIAGLPASGQANVTVTVNERRVPQAALGIMSFSSSPKAVTLG